MECELISYDFVLAIVRHVFHPMMESGIRSNIGLHSLEDREKSLQLFSPQRPLLLSVTHLLPLRYSDCDITSKNSGSINTVYV